MYPAHSRECDRLSVNQGKQAAKRVFDEKYGEGKWSLKDPNTRRDFRKMQKYFDRGFRDPQALPGPENRIPGEDFGI